MCAQSPFPMRYLDEVGHLDTNFDDRKSVDVGLARVFPHEDNLRFEGKDRDGKPWRVLVEKPGIMGFTDVWTADFDHNGTSDLLIAPFMPQNGRCAFRIGIVVLLFDKAGRPNAWGIDTQMPNWDQTERPYKPALILYPNRDRRAQFAAVHCEYAADRPGLATDWTITGVYEARDGRVVSIKKNNINIGPYVRAVQEAYPHDRYAVWAPVQPKDWPEAHPQPVFVDD
ncbi:MAG: hypothetical protein HYX72_06900 [Acidobacteria bacterium]|nr:hypothetical protein [Acidobacteriota bacterium]